MSKMVSTLTNSGSSNSFFSSTPNTASALQESKVLDRDNLLLISRLVIRGLLEYCMKSKNRLLTNEEPELGDFFVMIEKILRHGFKVSKNLLALRTPEQDLWQLIERVGKLSREAGEAVACVQGLPNISSPICRVRAWLRLAVMQKKISDYFQLVVEAKDLLSEYYEEWALLRHETTSVVFSGSLIGVRVIDCNLYLKEDDLNRQLLSVELSRYIKIPTVSLSEVVEEGEEGDEVKSILDQKNYLEERNRQLLANVTNLKRKLLLVEGMRRHRSNTTDLMIENAADEGGGGVGVSESGELQLSRSEELETAMALMEKDVHEKQETIINFRTQLDDVKKINKDLYQKLRTIEEGGKARDKALNKLEKESSKEKNNLSTKVASLEAKVQDLDLSNKKSDQLTSNLKLELRKKTEFCSELQNQLAELQDNNRLLEEARAGERLGREDLQVQLQTLQNASKEYIHLKAQYDAIKQKAGEYERTLEEMGVHLSQSKLKVEDLKEGSLAEAQWESDKEVISCKQCEQKFSVARRKHHCRNCGGIFCNTCSENTMPLPSSAKPVRVCDGCYELLLQRYSNNPSDN